MGAWLTRQRIAETINVLLTSSVTPAAPRTTTRTSAPPITLRPRATACAIPPAIARVAVLKATGKARGRDIGRHRHCTSPQTAAIATVSDQLRVATATSVNTKPGETVQVNLGNF